MRYALGAYAPGTHAPGTEGRSIISAQSHNMTTQNSQRVWMAISSKDRTPLVDAFRRYAEICRVQNVIRPYTEVLA